MDVAVRNHTSSDIIVHCFDSFAGGRREVEGSPFSLSPDEVSPQFAVKQTANGDGKIEWSIEGGTNAVDVSTGDGDIIDVS